MSMEGRTEVSEALKKAREYEQKNITEEVNRQKPSFHVCAPIGWINDPNGFSVYKGEYHLFISTILMQRPGGLCTGDIVCRKIWLPGKTFRRPWLLIETMIMQAAFPAVLWNTRAGMY